MNDLKPKLQTVRSRIEQAAREASRKPGSVALLAVSKRQPTSKIRDLYACGQRQFGESYVQEALQKQQSLTDLDIEWHFIGPLQSNKTREVAEHFNWVQSADRPKLLQRLSDQRPAAMPPLNICLQVNIDLEKQKSGAKPGDIPDLARLANSLPGLKLRGLMAIPRLSATGQPERESFDRMSELFATLAEQGIELDTLSMGMSADLEQAIAAGSTMVRIGTDLFGPRD